MKLLKSIIKYKKADGLFGYGLLVDIAVITAIGFLIILIIANSTELGKQAWKSIKNILPFF